MIRAPRADELGQIAAFVASQQAQSESRDAMFDEQPEAIAAQLAAWESPWIETSRVADRGRGPVGFIGAEIDESLSRVWFHGPVVDDPDWHLVADALLTALTTEVPESTGKTAEVVGDVANTRLATFAERHGFVAGKVHRLLALPAPTIEGLEQPELAPIADEHVSAFLALHEQLFPGTYYSGRQLLAQAARGHAVVLGVVDDGRLAGYAAGRVDEAGDGYLDFVGVAPDRRRRGLGTTLVVAMGHALRARAPIAALRLTVSSENTEALAMYAKLGFETRSSAVGYRRSPEPSA